jgi:hypothetical protein
MTLALAVATSVDDRAGRAPAAGGPLALERAARGAVAGAAATAAMSMVMTAVRRVGLIDKLAPRLIVEDTITRVAPSGLRFARPATAMAHLAFGVGGGALFGLFGPALWGPRLAKGLVFAAAVLLSSYEGWVPAAGILPPLHRQRPDRAAELLVGHAVYGLILGRLAG